MLSVAILLIDVHNNLILGRHSTFFISEFYLQINQQTRCNLTRIYFVWALQV